MLNAVALAGLAAKSAILIVEFATQALSNGNSIRLWRSLRNRGAAYDSFRLRRRRTFVSQLIKPCRIIRHYG